ncbi:hypothetical protein GCM10028815_34660 [Mariniluteicoccus flavus]
MARAPHDYATWFGWGHSIPNGDPEQAYAEGVPFTGAIIGPPLVYPPDIMTADTPVGRINYLAVLPVTSAEMDFKISQPEGGDALIDRFIEQRPILLWGPLTLVAVVGYWMRRR